MLLATSCYSFAQSVYPVQTQPQKEESPKTKRLRLLARRRKEVTVIEEAESVLSSRSYLARIRAVCHSLEEQNFNYWAPREVFESLDQVLLYRAQLLATEPTTRQGMLERSQKLQMLDWALMHNDGTSSECVANFENGWAAVPSDDQERLKMQQAKQNRAEIDRELAREFGGWPPLPTIRQIAEAAAKWGPQWPEHIEP
jgi:hypothetical protein